MNYCKLTFFQTFNAMRQYLSSYVDIQKNGDISLLLSGLKLDSSRNNWKHDLRTWDQAAFDDWMNGVYKTFNDLHINHDPKTFLYNEYVAFLCMKNYLELFYQEVPFKDIGILLGKINLVELNPSNFEWQHWLNCVEYVVNHENNIVG